MQFALNMHVYNGPLDVCENCMPLMHLEEFYIVGHDNIRRSHIAVL